MLPFRTFIVTFFLAATTIPSLLSAADTIPAQCATLFNLPPTTVREGDKQYMTQEVCDAKTFLLTRQDCVNGPGIRTPALNGANRDPRNCILMLDDAFAVKLAQLFKTDANFASANIHSGYRTSEGDRAVGNGASGFGNHTRGCAVDLNGGTWAKGTCGTACQYVKANSASLGVKIAYPNRAGEENHVEPTAVCNGSPGSPQIQGPQQFPPSGLTPPSSLGQLFAPPPTNPYQQMMAQQPLPQTQNPYSYYPPAPQPSPQPVSNTIVTDPPPSPSPTPSAFTAIQQIAGVTNPTSTSIATGTSIALNSNISNVATIQGTSQSSSTASNTVAYMPAVQQTFTSSDLRDSPSNNSMNFFSTFSILERVRQILISILQRLKPFGPQPSIRAANQNFIEVGF